MVNGVTGTGGRFSRTYVQVEATVHVSPLRLAPECGDVAGQESLVGGHHGIVCRWVDDEAHVQRDGDENGGQQHGEHTQSYHSPGTT